MKKEEIAQKFIRGHYHDWLLLGIIIEPACNRNSTSNVEVKLGDLNSDEIVTIKFPKPGNVSFSGDFDVLFDNAGCGNTDRTRASFDSSRTLKKVNAYKKKWNVGYHEGVTSPINNKTKNIDKFIVFSFLFFGGTLEVIAENFKVSSANKSVQRSHSRGTARAGHVRRHATRR